MASGEKKPARSRVVLTDISSRAWEHPADKGALVALRKLSGFDTVFKALSGLLPERSLRLLFLSDSVRVDERQFPSLHYALQQTREHLSLAGELLGAESPHDRSRPGPSPWWRSTTRAICWRPRTARRCAGSPGTPRCAATEAPTSTKPMSPSSRAPIPCISTGTRSRGWASPRSVVPGSSSPSTRPGCSPPRCGASRRSR